ncbi:MAG: hypothetical protein IKI97_10905 [Clostridia bacterium]|nr:hypothetical protein [Clostridia bacterium]
MSERDKKVKEMLEIASSEYRNRNYAKAFNIANEAWEISPYDALAYMYRAFSHAWYAILEDDFLYEQDIMDDLSICIDVGFENGETDEYYEICKFCCKEYPDYMLFMLRELIEEINDKKIELANSADEQDLNDEINCIICELAVPFEDALETLWDLAIFTKIKHIDRCPEEIFKYALGFIEEYRDISGRYAFYDYEDKFNEIYEIKIKGDPNERTLEKLDSDYDLAKQRITRWKWHVELLNTAVDGKLEKLNNEIESLQAKKSNLGFFSFSQKKEIDARITSLQKEIGRYVYNRDHEIGVINSKVIAKYESLFKSNNQ